MARRTTVADLPGIPLPSGFRICTPEERKRAEMSPEARARVEATIREPPRWWSRCHPWVDRARALAHAASITAVIG